MNLIFQSGLIIDSFFLKDFVDNILEIPNDIIEDKKKEIYFLKPTYLIDGDISLYKS